MTDRDYFELRRLSDNLTYQFDRKTRSNGQIGYQRRDQDLWIVFDPQWGWIAHNETTKSITVKSWSVLPKDQQDHPPAGEWVSKKGEKSYIYELVYPLHR